ncbi:MAG: holo-ACP synthase [Nevskiaceae bacterium]|nr:MAG: holo-ACP synthase [Nevskiaceae bacterium]
MTRRLPPVRRRASARSAARGGIHGIGVDILRESRIEKIWARHGRRFAEKILADAELDAFAQARHPVRFLAKAFAAKEACAKALGSGFAGVAYRDVGTLREGSGKPVLIFSARLRARLRRLGIQGGHVSLSDEGGMVCAMVVLER